MRGKAILVWAALIAALLLASCSKNDDVTSNENEVSETAVKAAFTSQFPTAANVSWGEVDGFKVASFTLKSTTKSTTSGTHKCSAWYKGNGKWEMTEIEYSSDQLPDTIRKAYTATEYGDGSWTIVKIVKLKKADGTERFKFELSKTGKNNVLLYFNVDGTLLKVKEKNKNYPDCGNYPNVVSDSLKAAVAKLYPNGTIGEVMQGHWGYWVEVKDGANQYNLFFNHKYELLMSISELTLTGLPQAVQDAFKASSYADWTVEKIKGITMPGFTQQVYLIFVSKDDHYMMLIYGADGKPFGGQDSFGCE